MKVLLRSAYIYLILICLFISCTQSPEKQNNYPISPVLFTKVILTDNFWLPRILKNTEVTIPIAFKQSEETGRIKNFEIAGGLKEGSFCSLYGFDDSDVFKIVEGASYSLMIKPDPVLESYLDSLIYKIGKAQEKDGYLYTNRTIMGDSALPMAGKQRWELIEEGSHELYNIGHMYEAAVAHFQATGKRSFLEIAIKSANLINKEFGWGKIEKYPGHQEIEIGLIKLYLVTEDPKYLDLAKFFLDVRGPDGWEYNQAHKKVTAQREPVGHAVRALYMYSAMADIAALTGDEAYLTSIDSIWENVVSKKLYITGGLGQTGGNEGFGPDYELPNMSAYCETCASIANVFWNHRMFLLSGERKYIDIMERTMYNALLSGVSLSGDRFFYPNPLESNGNKQRKEWYGCACCPSNISRFLPSVPGYIYAQKGNEIFINLYISNETEIETDQGVLKLIQKSEYPWDGKILIQLEPIHKANYNIKLRIPGWVMGSPVPGNLYSFFEFIDFYPEVKINGEDIEYEISNGYISLDQKWNPGDQIELILPMPVRKVIALDTVKADKGRFAIQRGPLMYCLEDMDNPSANVRHILTDINTDLFFYQSTQNSSIQGTVNFEARYVNKSLSEELVPDSEPSIFKAIPYCFWANRDPGQMLVWIPYK